VIGPELDLITFRGKTGAGESYSSIQKEDVQPVGGGVELRGSFLDRFK